MDPSAVRKEGNGKSLVYLIIAIALIAGAIAGAVYVFSTYPDVLQNTLLVIAVLAGVVLVIGVAIAILAFIVAIPYFARGREIQTDMSYDIDDVQEVDGKMIDDKKD